MPDRQQFATWLHEAVAAGARKDRVCAELRISLRTMQRWTTEETMKADARTTIVKPCPANALTAAERAEILAVCNSAEFASRPPGQIIPLLAKMYELGVSPSRSRPGVSNDNPYSESLFRTLKYCPQWPAEGFASLEAARHWVKVFTDWYNGEHRHSRIRYVTPNERHAGRDKDILKRREQLYQESRRRRPERWSGQTVIIPFLMDDRSRRRGC